MLKQAKEPKTTSVPDSASRILVKDATLKASHLGESCGSPSQARQGMSGRLLLLQPLHIPEENLNQLNINFRYLDPHFITSHRLRHLT